MSPKPGKYVLLARLLGKVPMWQYEWKVWDGKLDQWVGPRLQGSVYESWAAARAAKQLSHGLAGYRIKIKALEEWDLIRIRYVLDGESRHRGSWSVERI